MGSNWPLGPQLPKQISTLTDTMDQISKDVHSLAELASAPKLRTVDPEPIWHMLPWETPDVLNLTGLIVSSDKGGLYHFSIGNAIVFSFRIPATSTEVISLQGLGHIVVSRGLTISVSPDSGSDAYEATAIALPRES